jgi:hypothetical protein
VRQTQLSGFLAAKFDILKPRWLLTAAMRPRLRVECAFELGIQTDFSEPLMRVNIDSAARYVGSWDESAAWDQAADGYRD